MARFSIFLLVFIPVFLSPGKTLAQPKANYNLQFDSLATRWDEGMPLGNGWLGALIWEKENSLRISLDRVDLWDDRPMPEIDKLKFKWVVDQVNKGLYDTVQKLGDRPYDLYPAPTKIPGAALEFALSSFGKVISNTLNLADGLNTIEFKNGIILKNFIHAVNEEGHFKISNLPLEALKTGGNTFIPKLKVPNYNIATTNEDGNAHSGAGLHSLGYDKGAISKTPTSLRYHQPTSKGNYYEVLVEWEIIFPNTIIGSWTISLNKRAHLRDLNPAKEGPSAWEVHEKWWRNYWDKSAISLPDTLLEKQYYLELYKMASVARNNTPPISLQAIWTADNGSLPPWKGDIHNDLNTELSYWPFYAGNHLEEAASFTNWLWKVKGQNKKWTKSYFGVGGLNVPGVTTISGKEMGGWIQYSMSPSTAAWLAQHFYWQWKYSMDKSFLIERCKPWFDEVYLYFKNILVTDPATNLYKLPLSSSPEIHDNSIMAWFKGWTNYDLALVKSFYKYYIEILEATTGKYPADIARESLLLPNLDTNKTGLTIAPGNNNDQSHRHLSPYMALYPLGLLDIRNEKEKEVISKSIQQIEKLGTTAWVGYSFSWMANVYARAGNGDKAREMLRIFATNFCSSNSFHLNGDQKGGQYSNFTYRPFTLEGNFAFAQAIHEMLLQCDKEGIEIFPALPSDWQNVGFENLRAQGAFLITAKIEKGILDEVKGHSQKGGLLKLKLPFKTFFLKDTRKKYTLKRNILEIHMKPGEEVIVKNGYE